MFIIPRLLLLISSTMSAVVQWVLDCAGALKGE